MNKLNLTRTLAVTTLAAGLAFGATVPAQASHGGGGGVSKSGQCSAGGSWTLKAKTDDGQIEAEFEVDTNVAGQTFAWKLKDNGHLASKGSSTTGGASGSFSVQRKIADLSGSDKIAFVAKNAANGNVCKGSVTL